MLNMAHFSREGDSFTWRTMAWAAVVAVAFLFAGFLFAEQVSPEVGFVVATLGPFVAIGMVVAEARRRP